MGDNVVYVPMMGKGGPVGIIEIHGLYSEGISNKGSFERPVSALKAMIAASDFK